MRKGKNTNFFEMIDRSNCKHRQQAINHLQKYIRHKVNIIIKLLRKFHSLIMISFTVVHVTIMTSVCASTSITLFWLIVDCVVLSAQEG
jgi:hypothetical protein